MNTTDGIYQNLVTMRPAIHKSWTSLMTAVSASKNTECLKELYNAFQMLLCGERYENVYT
jgi:hypothetical protein